MCGLSFFCFVVVVFFFVFFCYPDVILSRRTTVRVEGTHGHVGAGVKNNGLSGGDRR